MTTLVDSANHLAAPSAAAFAVHTSPYAYAHAAPMPAASSRDDDVMQDVASTANGAASSAPHLEPAYSSGDDFKRQRVNPQPPLATHQTAVRAQHAMPPPSVAASHQAAPFAVPAQPAHHTVASDGGVADSIKRRARTPNTSTTPAASGSGSRGAASNSLEATVQRGPGLPLSEIPLLIKRLEKVSNEDSRTKLLYTVCFPHFTGPIPDRTAKKTLRLFSGYASDELRAAGQAKLESFVDDLDLLRKVARLLDLQVTNDQQLVSTIMDWLASPEVVVHQPKEEAAGADGAGPAARKRKPKDKREKRPPNPYLLFAVDHREQVAAASPGMQMMEVNRLLGQLWARADDATKAKYTKASQEARILWDLEHPEQAAAAAAAAAAGSGRKRKRADAAAPVQDDPAHAPAALSDQDSEVSDQYRRTGTPAMMAGSSHQSPSPTVDHELALRLQSSIARILSTADINKFSLRQVKAALAQEFSDKVVTHNQRLISSLVDRELLAMPE